MPERETADDMFAFRMLMEKYREGQRELHCLFVTKKKLMTGFQEKSCDTV